MKTLILLLFISATLFAQSIWTELNGPIKNNINYFAHDVICTDNGITYFSENGIKRAFPDLKTYHISKSGDNYLLCADQSLFYSNDRINWGISQSPNVKFNKTLEINGLLYACTQNGILVSEYNGASWSPFALNDNIVDFQILSNSAIFCAVSENSFYYTKDLASTWKTFNLGLSSNKITGIDIFAYYAGENDIMLTSYNGCFFIDSDDLGDSTKAWEQRNNGLTNLEVNCFTSYNEVHRIGTNSGIFYTSDKGLTWKKNSGMDLPIIQLEGTKAITKKGGSYIAPNVLANASYALSGFTNYTAIAVKSSNEVYIGTKGHGIFKSIDGGANFIYLTNGLTDFRIQDIMLDDFNNIYVATPSGVFKSVNDGLNWEAINPLNKNVQCLIKSAQGHELDNFGGGEAAFYLLETNNNWNGGPNSLVGKMYGVAYNPQMNKYIAACDGGIFTSAIDFIAWTKIESFRGRSIAIGKNGEIYVGLNLGTIKRTTDFGSTWENAGWLSSDAIRDLVVDNEGNIYAAHAYGVSKSTNKGDSWSLFVDGFTDPNAVLETECLAINTSGYLFAGTKGVGAYRTTNPVTSLESENEPLPNDFILYQNYPNPFNPSTVIEFALPETGNVSLKVFNSIGEEVAELVNNEMIAGYHSINFDASSLTSGIYFYRITTGNFTQTNKMILLR
ncbi:MAG: T9SS type A sorting domain-containing protein [Bacteroidetes bacterium]|nr:T9SS type A sorting domain-containing protein [Bacteroidota bacterium]MBU1679128.1 T9SS type A sorting domain-containing protein [Bacteroidota bacterium]MBU2507254.1 T9SS type A sorting domain-containing protein [Bacteroidota bacterium]